MATSNTIAGRTHAHGATSSTSNDTTRPEQPRSGYATRSRVSAGLTTLETTGPAPKRQRTEKPAFKQVELDQLKAANKVLVLEYSSTGGGHTARSLDPILQATHTPEEHAARTLDSVAAAVDTGKLCPGDCVVIAAPPRWVQDLDGGRVGGLHNKIKELEDKGLNVIVKQSDKTITGVYQSNGDSDNVAMLRDFVYKPMRNVARTPSSVASPANPVDDAKNFRKASATSTKKLMAELVAAVGEDGKGKIAVLGDMAPALQKAASSLGIQKSLEIGNHQGLFIGEGRQKLDGKNLAYLHKASGGGHAQKLALVEYTADVNVVPDLPTTMHKLGIGADTSKAEARLKVNGFLLAHATELPLDGQASSKPGILKGKNVTDAGDVQALIYLYVNAYTPETVKHIKDKIQNNAEGFGNCIFAVCGKDAIQNSAGDGPKNILHVVMAGHADGVTNGGFGTTSEFDYMAHHGYAGDFVVFPVVNQHEQESNAAALAGRHPGRVVDATGAVDKLHEAIDSLVERRTKQNGPHEHMQGDSSALLAAAQSPTSGPQHAAALLASLFQADDADGEQMRPNAIAATTAMNQYNQNDIAKESRRVFKLMVPALDAIIKGKDECNIRPTTKVDVQPVQIAAIHDHLLSIGTGTPTNAVKDLMKVNFGSTGSHELAAGLASKLAELTAMPAGQAKKDSALSVLKDLAENHVALGW